VRVLGIDPGSRYLGFGLVERRGGVLTHVAHGVVKADGRAPLHQRLHQLHDALEDVLATFQPDVVAVEGVFTHKNARSALVLGHARGVALLLAARSGLDVFEYAPARVKKAVGASGAGGKDSVARMVRRLLELEPTPERADATDALAVALCHLGQVGFVARPSGTARRSGGADFASRLSPGYVAPRKAAS